MEAFELPSARREVDRSAPLTALEDARLRLELAVDAAGIGSFDWDLSTQALVWDDRLAVLLGAGGAAPLTAALFADRILAADRPGVQSATVAAIKSCGDLRVDFRVIEDAGATRWLTTRARVLCDGTGRAVRVVGAVFDSSIVHTDREQAARALDTMATAYATIDAHWDISYANQAARAIIADRGEPVGRSVWDLVPALSAPAISAMLRGVMEGGQPTTLELRRPSGGAWIEVSVQPVANGIAVLVTDITARREAQAQAERAAERLALLAQAGTALVQRRPVADTAEAGLELIVPHLASAAMTYLRDPSHRKLRLVALRHEDPASEADIRRLFQELPLGDDPATATGRAVLTGKTQIIGDLDMALIERATSDLELRARLGAMEATGVLAVPLVSRGESIGFIGLLGRDGRTPSGPDLVLIEDIASRIASAIDNAQIFGQVQQARQTAELVTSRLEFLASIADALGSTLDAEQASQRLARMLVPTLSDWCMVTLLDDDGHVEDIASHHSDPRQQELLDVYVRGRRDALASDDALLTEAVGAGNPLFQVGGDDLLARLRENPRGGDDADALLQLAPGAVTALPILARDRTLGVISLYNTASRGVPTSGELDAAREVARRAGLVLDNARLYARSQSMAETLQRSLLTPAMSSSDLEVATRYVPAIADAQVGGDWYDAFQTPDGTTNLVIGDVMGHDTDAAALMGQLRTMVRAIAVDRQEPPGAVLGRVDAAAQTLGVDTTATAVLAQVLPGRSPGGARQLRWANAGHPLPMLVMPDGAVRVLQAPPDLLLGLGTGTARADHVIDLPVGATVLMFTDGLVEGRAQPLDIGMRRLALAAGPLAALPLEELCDQLLGALLPAQGAEDDVALVVLRVKGACPK